ncbi:hypothetical protein Dsin_021147 [Dipteronia sinensis]|uniref:MADS-box domain-containing protein n=1 Tax=Dipteronia sinensis TaxID=43782 RepID=A0AAE0E4N4_9ROSI|nr:hypothetical protein Dsin_021147 [Dipteronia sinensis]
MGRKKLLIKRLECAKARQSKYSKRKIGILKKAKELSVLCDVDLALVMFSPSGTPSVYVGKDKDLHRVVERLSIMSIEDREESEWKNPHTINDLAKLQIMEDHLVASLDCIRAKKRDLIIQEQQNQSIQASLPQGEPII